MKKIKLNICSLGDPTDPKTWSGTPFNLYSELKKSNHLGIAFNSKLMLNKYLTKVINILNRFLYKKSIDIERGLLYRYLNSAKVKYKTAKSTTNYTLHTGTLDLPFIVKPANQKHFLFCDSTWDLWSKNSTNMNGYTPELLKDAKRLEIKAYEQMDHLFPISEYVKNNLITHYKVDPCKITVVGTGRGIIKPYFGKKDYSNGKILFVAKGRFNDKGGPLVLEAFSKAISKNPNLELAIIGQSDYINQINLPNVKTYGFIKAEELQEIFNQSSLFLMPAINEPWGLVYLEALSCKIPLVGLNRNSFPEISGFGKYGFGLNEIDSDKLCEILINAFSNIEMLEDMGSTGQEFCLNNYSWSNTVSKIIESMES